MSQAMVILMVHDDRAWLVRGDWSRTVDLPEFLAWAAYCGVELPPIGGDGSRRVALETPTSRDLFEHMWSAFRDAHKRH